MEDKLKAQYTVSEDEYIRACKLYARPTLRPVLVCVILLLLVIILALSTSSELIQELAWGAVIGVSMGYFITLYILLPWRTRYQYRNHLAVREPVSISLAETGLCFESGIGNAEINWAHIYRWRHNEEMFLVYQAPMIYHVVPRHIGELTSAIESALRAHVGEPT